jgi:pimeloyl-ACP methyl ester carboxylesterase
MRKRKIILILVMVIGITYLLGPTPGKPVYDKKLPAVPELAQLEEYVREHEAKHRLRPDNEARIVWENDSTKKITEYALVYLHGFSASQGEGHPVHVNTARRFGFNLYLARLAEHGIDTSEQLLNLTADRYWESAKEALAIGRKIGKKVILMGTSTGATQALQLAATYPDAVAALILYSPNIAIKDPSARLLNDPWGLQIARLVKQSDYLVPADTTARYRQYWNTPYRIEALTELEEMMETTMKEEQFAKVKQPVLMLYYFRDEAHQDEVVKVSAMKEMFGQLGTPAGSKREKAMPLTGNHVLASPIKSADVAGVEKETAGFLMEILKLKEVR